MSVYGLMDRDDGVDLIVMWPTRAGWISQATQHAQVVAHHVGPDAGTTLEPVAAALEGVSRALWERFAHIDNSSFWDWLRRMAGVLLRHPPDPVPQMPDPDLEWIARLGRAVEAARSPELTRAAHAEVFAELDAIGTALLGNLDGRAAQARFMERARPDPRQVETAFQVLSGEATSGASLRGLTLVEPASGAVALTRWLAAAAHLWAEATQRDVTDAADEVPMLQPALRPIVVRVLAAVGAETHAVEHALSDEFRTAGALRVLRTLSDAYFGLRQTLVVMAERRRDDSLCLAGRVPIAPGHPGDVPDRLIGREIATRLDALTS